jgi:hypothetical protein
LRILRSTAAEDDIGLPAIALAAEEKCITTTTATSDESAPDAKRFKPDEARAPAPSAPSIAMMHFDGAKLKRPVLQQLAKEFGVSATLKNGEIIKQLTEKQPSEAGTCVVCMATPKTVLLMPCRHLCVCKACSDKLTPDRTCPMCRNSIVEKITVFL